MQSLQSDVQESGAAGVFFFPIGRKGAPGHTTFFLYSNAGKGLGLKLRGLPPIFTKLSHFSTMAAGITEGESYLL
jgi:hypothetical protein